ncbi:glycoside hydrolase family 97 catalytic domain-containing protein [Diaminobutyricibacter tongyongensis]|uniref:glycoside hydrolase family 97 catalytic domain-containing protein n=1 Tax=Leifsonia tongyongensis TaxID=1268043 RepID=UPI0023DB6D1F|nr:glycoside hydrolase family 97 catalytic domain-containing protein [Diaminobutyricibacter tongyongensis]
MLRSSGAGIHLVVESDAAEILRVRLGVTIGNMDLSVDSVPVRSSVSTVTEKLYPVSGKTTTASSHEMDELTATFVHQTGLEWQVLLRVADDGVAVRYAIPDLQGVGSFDIDTTTLDLSAFDRGWLLDYQTWYETPRFGRDCSELDDGDYGLPILLRDGGDTYVLVTESDIDGSFSGAHAVIDASAQTLRFQQADTAVEIVRGNVTPWRVFIVGDLATIVESQLVDELAPPTHPMMRDASWVRPGRAAWSWWSDFYSSAQLHRQKHFVDVAAELGWEHLLIDCGWEETWVPEIVAYASRFGIQVHLWTIWHDINGSEKLQKLALWRSWGVAGIKVDFMESESKDRYRWYDSVLQETARLGLMVNFHGSVIPRGWARTWPQVIGYEAIRGSEYYVFYNDLPLTAEHNVIQPFTRNIVGAMDYTPIALTAPGRTTSDGHELGMSVAFECGITHFADSVDAYQARPLVARLLSELPASWDETKMLTGTPDTEAVLARRSGDRWFIGAVASGPARIIDVPLKRLGLGTWQSWIVTDDAESGSLAASQSVVHGVLKVEVAVDGGFAAILAPEGAALFRSTPISAEAAPAVEPKLALLDFSGEASLTVSPDAALRVPPGWHAADNGAGSWTVTAPETLREGALGVVTVERSGHRGVAVVNHARLIKPVIATVTPLSTLPMLAFMNESGPVERNQSNGGGNPNDGQRMNIAGVEYETGFGVSTPSSFDVHIGPHADRLVGHVGIDAETPHTSARALILGDGRLLFSTELVHGSAADAYDIDVQGVTILTLRTEQRSPVAAHVDWAAIHLTTNQSNAITSRADR